jgi:hypothetical protein
VQHRPEQRLAAGLALRDVLLGFAKPLLALADEVADLAEAEHQRSDGAGDGEDLDDYMVRLHALSSMEGAHCRAAR